MHIVVVLNLSISNPNKLLLHHPQIIIHCQGSHPTVPAQQQSTCEYRSSILKVRWNSRVAWCWCVVWPSRTSQKKGLLPASFRWPPWIRFAVVFGLGLLHKKTAKFADGQQSQFKTQCLLITLKSSQAV